MKRLRTGTLLTAALTGLFLVTPLQSEAASATGRALMRVLKTLGIEAIADLSFASAAPGDASAIISPTDKQAARFTVQGEANAYFAITLPKAITLTTGNGAKNETILVSDFASYPASSGVIASNGNAEISVGATRAPLASNQKDGVYSGTFTVEVVY